jgi:peptidoglycan/xylan/chitin deacetylase (PgdA/CDA1 family)
MTIRRIPILLYHSVSEQPPAALGPFYVTTAAFERHLELILEGGHQAITVSQLVDRLANHEHLPPHPVVITFDDGFADTLEMAAPRLWSRRLVGTVYLTTGYLSGGGLQPGVIAPGDMLPWGRVGDLEAAGLEVGAHAHTHAHLDVMPRAQAREEVRRSKALLEESLGHPVRSFAYPHGYTDPFVQGEVQAAGFDSACGVRNALSHALDDRWRIARLTVRADTPAERVAAWLRGEEAPIAGPGEALQTRAWRGLRRLSRLTSRRQPQRRPA